MTDQPVGVVEQLLADYVKEQRGARQEKTSYAEAAALAWNSFNERVGSFADEHSSL